MVAVKKATVGERLPPHIFFLGSAIFHYLGPAFAVLLFAHVSVPGVAWLRIASAAVVFAIWRRPWRMFFSASWSTRRILIALGVVLGLMNACFYLAIAHIPLGTVGAIEFLGPVTLAALGARTTRNISALVLAAAGGWLLTDARFGGEPLGFLFAFANCLLFALYIILGHRIAEDGGTTGIDRLGAAMLIALITISPLGLGDALATFAQPLVLLWGIGVSVCSSVIPYICDQLAMARLPRATYALLLSLLPASAAIMGMVILRQVPALLEIAGILLVVGGVVLQRAADVPEKKIVKSS